MTFQIKYTLFFSCFWILSNNLSAQDTWTLEKCINHAMEASLDVQRSDLNIRSTEITANLAKEARYPSLSANANINWNFGRSVDPTSNSFISKTIFSNNYGLNSGITLFDGFRIKNNITKTGIDLKAAEADKMQIQNDIALQVANLYLNVLFAKENIEIADRQKQLNTQQLNRINKSIKAGALPASERLTLEAQLAGNDQAIIVAENNYDLALFRLKQSLRINPSSEFNISTPEDILIETELDLLTYEEVLTSALKQRYDLHAANLRTESAELDVDIAKAGYYPRVVMGGNIGTNYSNQALEEIGTQIITRQEDYTINGIDATVSRDFEIPLTDTQPFTDQLSTFLSYGFGVQVSVPIYNNGITKGNVSRAQINVENQRLAKIQLSENLQMTIQQSMADAKAAKKKLAASDKTLETQRAVLENISKRLAVGASNTFEWDTQKTNLENAEFSRLLDKYDYIFKMKVIEFYLGKSMKL